MQAVSRLLVATAVALSTGVVNAADTPPPARVLVRVHPTGSQYCGVDSLYLAIQRPDAPPVTMRQLEADLPVGSNGVTIDAMVSAARKHGVFAQAVRTDMERLKRWGCRAVLHVDGQHYVTFAGIDEDRLLVFDNAIGLIECTPEWFAERYHWDGVAVVVGPPPSELLIGTWGPGVAAVLGGVAVCCLGARWLLNWQSRTAARRTPT